MSYRDPKAALRALYDLATAQGGYFTAKQAATVGYGRRHLDYHAKAGNFERAEHGLYRLPTVPVPEHDDLIRLHFWSRDRKDRPQAIVSHDTALFLHELSDLLPPKTHLTVPPSFRKPTPKGCVIHKAALRPAEVEDRGGYRITTPLRTLLDVAGTSIAREHLERAVEDALDRGLVRRSALTAALKNHPLADRLAACSALVHAPG